MKNLKNIGLGLATLFFAFSIVFSMSSFKGEKENEFVVMKSSGVWEIIDPNTQGVEWDCFPEGEACSGYLKDNAIPNEDGTYPTSEVENILTGFRYEPLNK